MKNTYTIQGSKAMRALLPVMIVCGCLLIGCGARPGGRSAHSGWLAAPANVDTNVTLNRETTCTVFGPSKIDIVPPPSSGTGTGDSPCVDQALVVDAVDVIALPTYVCHAVSSATGSCSVRGPQPDGQLFNGG